jgi:hypothetical protein
MKPPDNSPPSWKTGAKNNLHVVIQNTTDLASTMKVYPLANLAISPRSPIEVWGLAAQTYGGAL